MERLARFEDHRYVGDKRTQIVHDIDLCEDPEHLQGMVAAESYLAFGPDTLPEARNRGYRPCRVCGRAAEAQAEAAAAG